MTQFYFANHKRKPQQNKTKETKKNSSCTKNYLVAFFMFTHK